MYKNVWIFFFSSWVRVEQVMHLNHYLLSEAELVYFWSLPAVGNVVHLCSDQIPVKVWVKVLEKNKSRFGCALPKKLNQI